MKRLLLVLLALLAMGAAPALAAVPQTIVVDGANDFDPSNLLDDDTADTQPACVPVAYPMDLGKIYMTNDANFLYIGMEFVQKCYGNINLGMAFDMNTAGGGTTDPFGRKIGWASVPFKPDWVVYDVLANTFNYEILYRDTLGAWVNRSLLINPSWGGGSNGLGIVDSSFHELKIPLSVLGATVGMPMHVEFWLTQEGNTHGPLDAMCSDNIQMSRGTTTTFDTTAAAQMTCMATYTVQNAVDNDPPTVASAQAVNFAVQADRTFLPFTNKVDVSFNEPVNLASAQTVGNYAVTLGATTFPVSLAQRDPAATNVVHLTLSGVVYSDPAAFSVRVTNVMDPASNVIVNNGTTNVRSFFIQEVTFNGDMRVGLCSGNFAPADTFAVEGSMIPLSFGLCDNGLMYDAEGDSIYTTIVPFCLPVSPVTGKGEADLEWKFSRICSQFEPLANNRLYHLTSDNGAFATINESWNNDNPANFVAHAVDVIFKVDATRRTPLPGDVITLLGNSNPLHFTQPGTPMLDNGVAPDAVAGDMIYTARVTFPACSPKNVAWKVDFNGVIECAGQGDRSVYLNDLLYSSATPIVLPARGIDRCEVTDKPLTVVFKLNLDHFNPLPSPPADTAAIMGSQLPLAWDYRAPASLLLNDGAGYDTQAGDVVFTRAVTFPDSTRFQVYFKYWENGVLECNTIPDRMLTLDDVAYNSGTPIIRLVNVWDYCSDPTAVGDAAPAQGPGFALLRPVMPNPVTRRASISFDLRRAGHVTLSIYDVGGRRVARLLNEERAVGQHAVAWDGRGDNGVRLSSGVYLYELSMGRERVTRRLILTH